MTEDFTELSGHAAVLRRRGWIIVVAALLGAVLGALASPLASPAYTAESVVLLPAPPDGTDTAVVDTQVEVITSDRVVQAVQDELGGSASASDLVKSLTVEVVTDTTAISITAARPTPDEAAQVANVFADSYVQVVEADQLQRQESVIASLEQQLEETSGRLVALRRQLPDLDGVDLAEVKAALARQQQRQSRLVDLLAETQDPTTAQPPPSVLQEAVAPPSNGLAGRLRTAFFGLVLGLLVGLAIAYARHHADDRILDQGELVSLVGRTPILGRIPRASKSRRGGGVLGDPGSKTAEAYRALAVNLRLRVEHPEATTGAGTGVMALIVSGSPGEGKSSVAGDLALTAAGMGLRVALVDADLRNPQLATRFNVAAQPGLTDVLQQGPAGTAHPVEVGTDNLRLLPAGVLHADPATLLSRANRTNVWDQLRAENDLVVVDTAPMLYAAETLELATVADRVVLIVERGRTTRRDVRAVVERMDLVGARPAGAVLTKVPAKDVVGGYYPQPALTPRSRGVEEQAARSAWSWRRAGAHRPAWLAQG